MLSQLVTRGLPKLRAERLPRWQPPRIGGRLGVVGGGAEGRIP